MEGPHGPNHSVRFQFGTADDLDFNTGGVGALLPRSFDIDGPASTHGLPWKRRGDPAARLGAHCSAAFSTVVQQQVHSVFPRKSSDTDWMVFNHGQGAVAFDQIEDG